MMNDKYLVTGTDFSPCSINAVRYAMALCNSIGAWLIIVHAVDKARSESQAASDLSTAVGPLLDEYPQLSVTCQVVHQKPMEAICLAASEYNAMCIVVGAMGMHADDDIFIGTTTGDLVRNGNAPVLIIPDGCQYARFGHVLFAVKNPYVASKEILDPFLSLMQSYSPAVDLLHVTQDTMPDLSSFPDPYPISAHTDTVQSSDSDNIYHSVQSWLSEHHTDLLVVISRMRGFFEGLFAQHTKSSSIFHVDLPILVLHGKIRP